MNVACIVGARPNFMKMAPILRALNNQVGFSTTLIHTGQHYDKNLSDVFFEDLGIKRPDVSLGVGSGSHGQQTADVLKAVEQELIKATSEGRPFDRLVVVGDVNSTLAASLAAVKLHIPVAHVEAGLRSGDRSMPEEINRIVTDSIADLLLVSEPGGVENLRKEGHPEDHIHLVGNVMIDTLFSQLEKAKQSDILRKVEVEPHTYAVVTLHRPSNVDDAGTLAALVDVLIEIADELPILFPIHPRTQSRLSTFGLKQRLEQAHRVHCLDPLGYLDFLCLTSQAKVIVTDSGGLQEESTALGIPCLTMRENTERPITVEQGTSTLIGNDSQRLATYLNQVINGHYKQGNCPSLWDGKAAERIASLLVKSPP